MVDRQLESVAEISNFQCTDMLQYIETLRIAIGFNITYQYVVIQYIKTYQYVVFQCIETPTYSYVSIY